MMNIRPIKSELKSKRIKFEEDKPIRWSYMKILREYSTLKKIYPIDPYAEVYQMRSNMWAILTDSLDGMGDPWMFLIDGPEKAMLIDTSFGLGDLKGLVHELIGDKELIVVNTHSHFDHAYGNAQFEKCYCHEAEVFRMEKTNNSHIWDYLFDEQGDGKWAEFDRNDLIHYQHYEIAGVPDGYLFDLGQGYCVEAVHLPGHTPGQCGFYDHHNHTIMIGDTSAIGHAEAQEPYGECCTVKALRDALRKLKPRFDEIEGVFPGHGALDQPSCSLQYILDAAESVVRNPGNYDSEKVLHIKDEAFTVFTKNIYEGSCIRYTDSNVGED